MPFSFQYLCEGTDFDIKHDQNALLVYRRSADSRHAKILTELGESLSLVGLTVTIDVDYEWLRVEKGKIDLSRLAEEIALQIRLQSSQGNPSVTNKYEEPGETT